VFNDELYGGIYDGGNGVRRWDGSAWQIVGGTANSFITALGGYDQLVPILKPLLLRPWYWIRGCEGLSAGVPCVG
jgi:hypothetical protein